MSGRTSARTMDESSVTIMDATKPQDTHPHSFHSGLVSPHGGAAGEGEGCGREWGFPFRSVLAALLLLALYSSVVVSVSLFSPSSTPGVPVCNATGATFPCQVPDAALMAAMSPSAPGAASTPSPLPWSASAPPQASASPGGPPLDAAAALRVCVEPQALSSAQRQLFPMWASDGSGHRLNGDVALHILWYGGWSEDHKGAIRTFLGSLTEDVDPSALGFPAGTPSVKDWWSLVGDAVGANVGGGGITVTLGEEMDAGLDFGEGFVPPEDVPSILTKVTSAPTAGPGQNATNLPSDPSALYVVLVGAGVVTPLLCTTDPQGYYNGLWAGVGLAGPKQLTYAYAVSPKQGKDCDVTAAVSKVSWLNASAPSGDASLDAVIDAIGGAMASAVTNADGKGFVSTESCPYALNNVTFNCDILTTCRHHYGRIGAAPTTGAAYNAVGKSGTPYLLNQLFSQSCSSGSANETGVFNSTLPIDYGSLNMDVMPWTLLKDVMDLTASLTPPTVAALPSPKSLTVPYTPDHSANAPYSGLEISLNSLRQAGVLNALAASGRNYTVFVPEMGGPEGGWQDWQLYNVAEGRHDAASLKAMATAGTPLVSLSHQAKLSLGYTAPPASAPASAAAGKLTVGWGAGAPAVEITGADLYCTSAVCFHQTAMTL